MKKWMALLLACLLCWCAVGAMAETVELEYRRGIIKLYPNGYTQRFNAFQSHDAATTQYVITGTITGDSPLDIYLVPYGQAYATEDVVYNISFDGVKIQTLDGYTAIRIGATEKDKYNEHTVTLNLSNHGDSLVSAHGYAAIHSPFYPVTVNIHNHSGSLTLVDEKGIYGAFNSNITLNVAGSKVTDGTNSLLITDTEQSLTPVNGLEPTCDTDGNLKYWTCDKCHMCFLDANAERVTTREGVRLRALGHDLQKVPAKAPTYDQEGNIEHYRCTRCGRLFSDENETQELTASDVVLVKLVRTDDLPQTGDSSRLTGWLALLGACCAGLWRLNRRRG